MQKRPVQAHFLGQNWHFLIGSCFLFYSFQVAFSGQVFSKSWLPAATKRTKAHVDFLVPKGWPKPIWDFEKKPLAAEKIELGRALFYDPILTSTDQHFRAALYDFGKK